MKHTMLSVATVALLAASSTVALAQANMTGTNPPSANEPTTSNEPGTATNPGNTSATAPRHMSSRMSPERVKRIQNALDQNGQHVAVDGRWGKQTAAAVRNFQKENGLKPTGRVDHQTRQKLGLSG